MTDRRLRDVTVQSDQLPDDLRAFLLVLRQALLMIVRYVERRYSL